MKAIIRRRPVTEQRPLGPRPLGPRLLLKVINSCLVCQDEI